MDKDMTNSRKKNSNQNEFGRKHIIQPHLVTHNEPEPIQKMTKETEGEGTGQASEKALEAQKISQIANPQLTTKLELEQKLVGQHSPSSKAATHVKSAKITNVDEGETEMSQPSYMVTGKGNEQKYSADTFEHQGEIGNGQKLQEFDKVMTKLYYQGSKQPQEEDAIGDDVAQHDPSQDQILATRQGESRATTAHTELADVPSKEADPIEGESYLERDRHARHASDDQGGRNLEERSSHTLEQNSLTFAPNHSLQNSGDPLLYIQNDRVYQDMPVEQNLFLLDDKVSFLMDHEPDQPESEDLHLSQSARQIPQASSSPGPHHFGHQNHSDHSDELSKIQDFERMDQQMSNYEDENRLANLKYVVNSISPIKPTSNRMHITPGHSNSSMKQSDYSDPKSESNLSTPEVDPYQEHDGPVKDFTADKKQLLASKEPLSSSSLQDDINLLDSAQGGIQLRQRGGQAGKPIAADDDEEDLEDGIDGGEDESGAKRSKAEASLDETVSELQRLINSEEYISQNVSADKSFDLAVEFEMNHIHKEKVSKKLEELIITIASAQWAMLCPLILEKLQAIEVYKLRACVECDELKKLPHRERRWVSAFKKKLTMKIEEMDQLTLFDDPIMDGDNDDKNNWNERNEVQDLDVLSAGEPQENGNDAEQAALDSEQEVRQDDQVYDDMGNEGRGGNYMHIGGGKIKYIMDSCNSDVIGKMKHKNDGLLSSNGGSGPGGGGSPQPKLIEFNWDPLENFRAKLYTLDTNGRWHDLGTGHFRIDYIARLQQYKMTLLQEQNSSIDLLKNEIIEPHIQFNRQRETIITWADKQRDQDLAVSFSTNVGAQYTWKKICQILYLDPYDNSNGTQIEADEPALLSFDSLPRLAEDLKNDFKLEPDAKQDILDHFLSNYNQNLTKLGELFEECEAGYLQRKQSRDQEVSFEDEILNFFYIYKGLIQLNDQKMLETIMSEKYYLQAFGALEWDPDALEGQPEVMDQIDELDPLAENNAAGRADIEDMASLVEEDDGLSPDSTHHSDGEGVNEEKAAGGTSLVEEEEMCRNNEENGDLITHEMQLRENMRLVAMNSSIDEPNLENAEDHDRAGQGHMNATIDGLQAAHQQDRLAPMGYNPAQARIDDHQDDGEESQPQSSSENQPQRQQSRLRGGKGMFKLFNEQEVIGRRFQKSQIMTTLMSRSHLGQIQNYAEESLVDRDECEEEQVAAEECNHGVQQPHEAEQEGDEDPSATREHIYPTQRQAAPSEEEAARSGAEMLATVEAAAAEASAESNDQSKTRFHTMMSDFAMGQHMGDRIRRTLDRRRVTHSAKNANMDQASLDEEERSLGSNGSGEQLMMQHEKREEDEMDAEKQEDKRLHPSRKHVKSYKLSTQYVNMTRYNRMQQEEEEEKVAGGQDGAAQSQLYYMQRRSNQLCQWINEDKQEDADDEQMYQQQDARDDGQEQQAQDDDNVDGELVGEAEEEEGQREEKPERQYLGRSTLNYRDFLQNKVKFKKVVDFSQFYYGQQQENGHADQHKGYRQGQEEQNNGSEANTSPNGMIDIEERININYRLQYLKDSVMARYIDDTSLKVINQLIMNNNREIIQFIFGIPQGDGDSSQSNQYGGGGGFNVLQNSKHGRAIGLNKDNQTIKDYIVELIKSKTNIPGRFLAIEFMIELCQVLKSLQFQPGMLGGASSFLYGSGGMGFNNRQVIDQLNQVNLIGLLAETLGIFVPTLESLEKHLSIKCEQDRQQLASFYKEKHDLEPSVIEQLLDINRQGAREDAGASIQAERGVEDFERGTTRLDQMKINSLEIIISFYQSAHLPMPDIHKFALGQDQLQRGLPFLVHLVQHLKYSPEHGIKVQICDFFKSLLDGEQTSLNQLPPKESLYKNVIKSFVQFLKQFSEQEWQGSERSDEDHSARYDLFRHLEYSAYLIMQILNKVTAEHRYPFRIFVMQNDVIQTVAQLARLDSKLLNIEIVKFYKSLLRSKDQNYIMMIIEKDLFYPVMHIFKQTYRARNPPMIQSTIRELFECIFRRTFGKMQTQKNEYYNSKLIDHLTRQNWEAMEIIFDPQYAEIFEKYNLKQGGTGMNSKSHLLDGKNGDNADYEEGQSRSQKSRDTDDIGSPFSDLSGPDMGEEFIPIHGNNPLCLTDRFADQVIVGEPRADTNTEFAAQAGTGQQASKGSGSTRIKFSIEKTNNGQQLGQSENDDRRIDQAFKNDQLARESETKSREAAIKWLERGLRLPHHPQYDSLGYRLFKSRQPSAAEDSPLELCLDTQNADGEVEEKAIQGGKDKQELEDSNDKREIEQELDLIEKEHDEASKKAEAMRGEEKRAEAADDKQEQKGAQEQQLAKWSKWLGKPSASQPSNDNALSQDEQQQQAQPLADHHQPTGALDDILLKSPTIPYPVSYAQQKTQSQQKLQVDSLCDVIKDMYPSRLQNSSSNQPSAQSLQSVHQMAGSGTASGTMAVQDRILKGTEGAAPATISVPLGTSLLDERQDRDEPENEHQLQGRRERSGEEEERAEGEREQKDKKQEMLNLLEGHEEEEGDQEVTIESRRSRNLDHPQGQGQDQQEAAAANQFGGLKNMLTSNNKRSSEAPDAAKKFSREPPKAPVGSALAAVKEVPQRQGLSKQPERKGSQERHSTSAPTKQLQTSLDIVKSDTDNKSKEAKSPRSCGNVFRFDVGYSLDNRKSTSEKERPKSQFVVSSQQSQKRPQYQHQSIQSSEISKQNHSSGSLGAPQIKPAGKSLSEYDKVSHSSSEHLLGIMGEEDLAKDLGMFDLEVIAMRQPPNSQNTKLGGLKSSPVQQSLTQKNSPPIEKAAISKSQSNSRKLGQKRKKSIDDVFALEVAGETKGQLLEEGEYAKGSRSPGSHAEPSPRQDEHSLFGPLLNKSGDPSRAGHYKKFKQSSTYQNKFSSATPPLSTTKRRASSGEKTKPSHLFHQTIAATPSPPSQAAVAEAKGLKPATPVAPGETGKKEAISTPQNTNSSSPNDDKVKQSPSDPAKQEDQKPLKTGGQRAEVAAPETDDGDKQQQQYSPKEQKSKLAQKRSIDVESGQITEKKPVDEKGPEIRDDSSPQQRDSSQDINKQQQSYDDEKVEKSAVKRQKVDDSTSPQQTKQNEQQDESAEKNV